MILSSFFGLVAESVWLAIFAYVSDFKVLVDVLQSLLFDSGNSALTGVKATSSNFGVNDDKSANEPSSDRSVFG